MAIYSDGLKTGVPLAADITLAEIPPDSGGVTGQSPQVQMAASVAATVELQLRNSSNNGNVWAQRYFLSAAAPIVVVPPPSTIILQANERLRVQLISSIIGSVQATMLT